MSFTAEDKSADLFPIKNAGVCLLSCSVAGQCRASHEAVAAFSEAHASIGAGVFGKFPQIDTRFHETFGKLLRTSPENISFVGNTAEGLSILANGYPFAPGDEIVSYVYEYPSNHYPWKAQEARGVKLKLLANFDPTKTVPNGLPCGFSLAELNDLITPATRVVALSHVQFHSGFAADLTALGALCKARGVELVLDVAQSLGGMPVYPEEIGAAAVVGSGWKWLFGPLGSGVMYTSPAFREKIVPTMLGPYVMKQQTHYLDHTWNPLSGGAKFEYSTIAYPLAAGLEAAGRVLLKYPPETVRDEIFRLQDVLLSAIDRSRYLPILHRPENRSGVLSLVPLGANSAKAIKAAAFSRKVFLTEREGFVRVAPQFYLTDEEMLRAADVMNEAAA